MNKQQTEAATSLRLPVDDAEKASETALAAKLSGENVSPETIADDAVIPKEKAARVADVENIVRETLAIFGMDYDSMIRMDDKSLYARVVRRRPEVLSAVMQDENPVLAALKIAVGFQPYADFIEKYGEEPEVIVKAIREEVMTEMKQARASKESAVNSIKSPAFSGEIKPKKAKPKAKKEKTLDDIFKR